MRSDPVGRAELDAALADVCAAPQTDAPITGLCLRPARNTRAFPDRLSLTRAQGIAGDRWLAEPWLRTEAGAPHPGIQVSILQSRVLDLVWCAGQVHPGDPIVADLDCSETNLPVGTLIQAGSARLRVSDVPNYGCAKWKARYGEAAHAWVRAPGLAPLRLRGVLCAVETDGVVMLGDRLQVISRPG